MNAGLATDGWKGNIRDYIESAGKLHLSISRFGIKESIPVDPNGELLDGSHRVGCALALGITDIPVIIRPNYVWAPSWGYDWFAKAGMSEGDLGWLLNEYRDCRGPEND